MSGNKSQFVLVVYLELDGGDPREQIRRATSQALPGTFIRVMVGEVAPIAFGIPFPNAADWVWYRSDLVWQFSTSNPDRLSQWQTLLGELEGVI